MARAKRSQWLWMCGTALSVLLASALVGGSAASGWQTEAEPTAETDPPAPLNGSESPAPTDLSTAEVSDQDSGGSNSGEDETSSDNSDLLVVLLVAVIAVVGFGVLAGVIISRRAGRGEDDAGSVAPPGQR